MKTISVVVLASMIAAFAAIWIPFAEAACNPGNAAGFVQINSDPTSSYVAYQPATLCRCSLLSYRRFFAENRTDPVFSFSCTNNTNFCACNAAGNCFHSTGGLAKVNIYVVCQPNPSDCKTYAILEPSTAGDLTVVTDGTAQFASQNSSGHIYDAADILSSPSVFLNPATLSCKGCDPNLRNCPIS